MWSELNLELSMLCISSAVAVGHQIDQALTASLKCLIKSWRDNYRKKSTSVLEVSRRTEHGRRAVSWSARICGNSAVWAGICGLKKTRRDPRERDR